MAAMTRDEEIEAAWAEHNTRQIGNVARGLTPKLKNRLAEIQNWRCPYCGRRMEDGDSAPTFEHLLPTVLGGKDDEANLVVACVRCNQDRGFQMWPEHREALCAVIGRPTSHSKAVAPHPPPA
jgi:5-methylcytosine-specific restriction endonuclease McrA